MYREKPNLVFRIKTYLEYIALAECITILGLVVFCTCRWLRGG